SPRLFDNDILDDGRHAFTPGSTVDRASNLCTVYTTAPRQGNGKGNGSCFTASMKRSGYMGGVMASQGVKGAAIGLLMTVAAMQASQAQVPGLTADSIKIGSFGALTGPGYLYGKLPMNGVEVVFDEVNAAGGIHGRKLQLVREDDRCDAASAIAAIQKLVHQDQVFALIGGGCSNATFAARESIETAKIPTLVFASVHDGITTPPAPNIFSAALTAAIESQAQVVFAQQQGAKRIAMISMRDAWGRGRYEALM